jgi:hypothetical protein
MKRTMSWIPSHPSTTDYLPLPNVKLKKQGGCHYLPMSIKDDQNSPLGSSTTFQLLLAVETTVMVVNIAIDPKLDPPPPLLLLQQ